MELAEAGQFGLTFSLRRLLRLTHYHVTPAFAGHFIWRLHG